MCDDCGVGFGGDRSAARRTGWEPTSTRTQRDIDNGPLTCAACISRSLSDVLSAMADHAASERAEHARILAGCRRISAIPSGRSRLVASTQAFSAAQSAWEEAEAARIAQEQAEAEAAAAAAARPSSTGSSNGQTSRPSSGTQGEATGSSPAPSTPAPAGGRVTNIAVTNVSASSSSPGNVSFTVVISASGAVDASVQVSVGGRTATLGSGGAGTYSGTVTGVPAGSHSWTASAGGLSASGSITAY
ncbi:MAG: hypothetical protein BGO96_05385 [Micrococcales bacterium 73-15]|nr:MAG: hypothetical protein BGO96_05385 [Micrococcales bacterium 73-15]